MDQSVWIFLIGTFYRIVCLLVGYAFAYLGYRLYLKGVLEKEGEISGGYGGWKFAFRNVAPGVVFVILGVIVGGFGIVRPITTTIRNERTQPIVQTVPPSAKTTPIANPSNSSAGIETIETKISKGDKLSSGETQTLVGWMNEQLKNEQQPCPVVSTGGYTGSTSMSYETGKADHHWWDFIWKHDSPSPTIEPR